MPIRALSLSFTKCEKIKEKKRGSAKWLAPAAVALLAAALVLGAFCLDKEAQLQEQPQEETAAEAAELASGTFGDGFSWSLNDLGELRINGSGDMPDFRPDWEEGGEGLEPVPWKGYEPHVNHIILEGEITAGPMYV